jgi:hypothetical protein
VRFRAAGQPKWVLWCHCESCRKHSGAPASVFVSYEHDALKITQGEIVKFDSSPGVKRGFCGRCGSTLSCENARFASEIHLHVGAFDDRSQLKPKGELFAEERVPWLHLEGTR